MSRTAGAGQLEDLPDSPCWILKNGDDHSGHVGRGDGRGPAGTERQGQDAAFGDGTARHDGEQRIVQEDCGSDVDDGQTGPVHDALGEPVQPLVPRLVGAGRRHLRHRHLGHVHQRLEIAPLVAIAHTTAAASR